MENNESKEVCHKNRMCYYYNGIIELKDFCLNNILVEVKSYEDIFIYNILYKVFIDLKLSILDFLR